MKKFAFVTICGLLAFGVARPARADTITPGQLLSVSFDIQATPQAGQPEVFDPNLIFLEFRGGLTLSPNAFATATLFIDGLALGSTLADTSCSLCSSMSWQFASVGFPDVVQFPNPTVVDFSHVLPGTHGLITLTVDSGFLTFGDPPYTENAPVVVFDNIASCGPGCTAFRPVTMDAQNLTYRITPVPESNTLTLAGLAFGCLGIAHRRGQQLNVG